MGLSTEGVIDHIRQSLTAAAMEPITVAVGDHEVLAGRTSEFRWRWLATRLHTWVMATSFPTDATVSSLDDFLDWAVGYSSANKDGLPAGLQTGMAVVAVAVVPRADPALRGWAEKPHGSKFGVIAYPAVVDVAAGALVEPTRMKIGAIYVPHLRRVADAHLRPAVAQPGDA